MASAGAGGSAVAAKWQPCKRDEVLQASVVLSMNGNNTEVWLSRAPRLTSVCPVVVRLLREAWPSASIELHNRLNGPVLSAMINKEWVAIHSSSLKKAVYMDLSDAANREKQIKRALKTLFCTTQRTLLAHQVALRNHFKAHDWNKLAMPRPFLLKWEMGGGKTIGSLSASLGNTYSPARLLVVCSNSLIEYWMNNIMKTVLGNDKASSLINILGITVFKKICTEEPNFEDNFDLIIVDEIQMFKNFTHDMLDAINTIACASNALFLSGTPIVNGEDDLQGLMALMNEPIVKVKDVTADGIRWDRNAKNTGGGGTWASEFIPTGSNWNVARVMDVMHRSVSHFSPAIHGGSDYTKFYPRTSHVTMNVRMSHLAAVHYMERSGSLSFCAPGGAMMHAKTPFNNFYNKCQIMFLNESDPGLGFPLKVRLIGECLRDGSIPRPCVIFTHYLEKGVDVLHGELAKYGFAPQILTGKTPTLERQSIVNDYNAGKTPVLLITKAIAVGVSFLGTASLVQMDVMDNQESENQLKARVVRLDSHPDGHAHEVKFFKIISKFPEHMDRPDEAALKYAQDVYNEYFGHRQRSGREISKHQAWANIARMIRDDERGQTIDERMEARNQAKHKRVMVINESLDRCSIPTPSGSLALVAGHTRWSEMAGCTVDTKSGKLLIPAKVSKSRIQTIKAAMKNIWKYDESRAHSLMVSRALEAAMKTDSKWFRIAPGDVAKHKDFKATFQKELLGMMKVAAEAKAEQEAKKKAIARKKMATAQKKAATTARGSAKPKPRPRVTKTTTAKKNTRSQSQSKPAPKTVTKSTPKAPSKPKTESKSVRSSTRLGLKRSKETATAARKDGPAKKRKTVTTAITRKRAKAE